MNTRGGARYTLRWGSGLTGWGAWVAGGGGGVVGGVACCFPCLRCCPVGPHGYCAAGQQGAHPTCPRAFHPSGPGLGPFGGGAAGAATCLRCPCAGCMGPASAHLLTGVVICVSLPCSHPPPYRLLFFTDGCSPAGTHAALAGKKLTKRLYKLVAASAKGRTLRRGIKEVVKAVRKNQKGYVRLCIHVGGCGGEGKGRHAALLPIPCLRHRCLPLCTPAVGIGRPRAVLCA